MTTSLARNPVTFLSGGRYSVVRQHRPLRCSFGGDARACWGPRGGFGAGSGGYSTDWAAGSDSANTAVFLCCLLPLRLSLAWLPSFELRVIIWNTDEVVLEDDAFLVGEKTSVSGDNGCGLAAWSCLPLFSFSCLSWCPNLAFQPLNFKFQHLEPNPG